MPYELKPDTAIADIAFEAKGENLEELFKSAAQATMDGLVNTKTVEPKIEKTIDVKADNVDRLLFEFLEEIIFLKDKEGMVFNKIEIKEINEKKVKATLYGDKIKPEEHELMHDIKAVTMHYWRVEQTKEGWVANVVLDI